MPQMYGRRRTARTNISSIFTDSPSPVRAKRIPKDGRTDQAYSIIGESVQAATESPEEPKIDENLNEGLSMISYGSPRAKTMRGALLDHDANVRRSPRMQRRQPKAINCGQSDLGSSAVSVKSHSDLSAPDSPLSSQVKQTRRTKIETPGLQSSDIQETNDASFANKTLRSNGSDQQFSIETSLPPELRMHLEPLLNLSTSSSMSFTDWASQLTPYLSVSKIAEASYGEVYRLSLLVPSPDFSSSDESVLKIIALKPPKAHESKLKPSQRARLKAMSAPDSVASEINLLKHMSSTPGFANFRDLKVLHGSMAPSFVEAWRQYNRTVKKSAFPDPGRKGSYSNEQLWAVVEMQDAGDDLEDKEMQSVWAIWDIFWGVACALAKGEVGSGFEHRDLHLGNVCVKWSDSAKKGCHVEDSLQDGRKLNFTGAEITLIDYTLSRADIGEEDNRVAFLDLEKDHGIFEGDGDDDYQYDMYRYMRSAVFHGDPTTDIDPPYLSKKRNIRKQENGPDTSDTPWEQQHPITNLVWLHFVLYKLTEQLCEWPSSMSVKRRKAMPRTEYDATIAMEDKIRQLWGMLDLETLTQRWTDQGLGSAAGLVGWAVQNGWLSEKDVLGVNAVGAEADGNDELAENLDRLRIATHEMDEPQNESDESPLKPARRRPRNGGP